MTILRDKRAATGKSLSAFSRGIGLNYAQACQFERGDIRVPAKWRPVISEALNVSLEALFDERGFAREEV